MSWEIHSDNEVDGVCDAGCQSALLLAFFPQAVFQVDQNLCYTYKTRFSISERRLGDQSEGVDPDGDSSEASI